MGLIFDKSEYPFIKHIPIAIVMSISHISGCAMMCLEDEATRFQITLRSVGFHLPGMERETASYKHRAAPGVAMTSNGDNDTPVQPQSERDKRFFGVKPPQAMGAVA